MRTALLMSLLLGWLCPARAETVALVAPAYWCPFSCGTGGSQEGFTIEIVRAIFEPRGVTVSYENINYSRVLEMVRSGSKSASPSTIKEEAPDFIFPFEPIARNRFCFFTKPNATFIFTRSDRLPAGHYGVVQGYSYGKSLDALIHDKPNWFEHLSGDNLTVRLAKMVRADRLNAFIEEENTVNYTQAQNSELSLRNAGCDSPIYSYLAFSPKRADSVRHAEEFDVGIRLLRANGDLQKILSRYGLQDWKAELN